MARCHSGMVSRLDTYWGPSQPQHQVLSVLFRHGQVAVNKEQSDIAGVPGELQRRSIRCTHSAEPPVSGARADLSNARPSSRRDWSTAMLSGSVYSVTARHSDRLTGSFIYLSEKKTSHHTTAWVPAPPSVMLFHTITHWWRLMRVFSQTHLATNWFWFMV